MSRTKKMEEFFAKLFELVPINYNDLNVRIKVPEESEEQLILLQQSCPELILVNEEGQLYVTTMGLFTTFSRFFLRGNETACFTLAEQDDIINGVLVAEVKAKV